MGAGVLIVSTRPDFWSGLAEPFAGAGMRAEMVAGLEEALEKIRASAPALAILDRLDQSQAELRRALAGIVTANALVHTAVVSGLDEEAFHEAMEGFGVLMRLPDPPEPDDIRRLGEALKAVAF